jgi:hypothetical protein
MRSYGNDGWSLPNMIFSRSLPRMSLRSEAGKYFGAHPESSQYTLPLCSATAVISSVHGQPGWAATTVSAGNRAARLSMASGRACSILAPIPPGMPAPIPVVPTSIITGTRSPAMVSNSGLSAGSSTAKCPMIGWKWNPSTWWSLTAVTASATAEVLSGSTAPQAWMNVPGWRSRSPAT